MPTSHRRHRAVRTGVATLTAVLALAAAGCGEPAEDATPTIPSIDFTPVLVLHVDDDGVEAEDGPHDLQPSELDPPTVVGGSVLEVRNDGDGPARLRAGGAFDTGVLQPGERTVVVVVNDTAEDRRWPLDDGSTPTVPDGDEGPLGTLVVTPRTDG